LDGESSTPVPPGDCPLAGRREAVTVVAEISSVREAIVTQVADPDGLGPRPEADLEYDLAHEWTAIPRAADVTRGRPSVYVATETVDASGDHGYDMAHDVPGR
jgi:ApbE superfamily uncharacterized protein (UPF0280 family)